MFLFLKEVPVLKYILITEDDLSLSNGIALALKNPDFVIEQSPNIKTARQKLAEREYDLILLDINLPDGNGIDFLKEVKERYDCPVIMLTAKDLEIDIVIGLESGADDYITKPFSLAILRARVNTQLRKGEIKKKSEQYFIQGLFHFDFEKMEYRKNNCLIELSKTEQKLLFILVKNKGITLERSRLIDYVWTDGAEYVDENALSVSIKRLRDKLEENPSKPQYIKTVYGIGYMWEAE